MGEILEDGGVALAVDLGVDEGLPLAVRAGLVIQQLRQLPRLVPVDPHHRVDQQMDRQTVPVELHADRVDEEGHVALDDLDDRVGRLPAVFVELRRVDADRRLGIRSRPGQVQMGERRAVEVEHVGVEQVVGRCMGEVAANERLETLRVVGGQAVVGEGGDLLDPFRSSRRRTSSTSCPLLPPGPFEHSSRRDLARHRAGRGAPPRVGADARPAVRCRLPGRAPFRLSP